MDCAPRVSGRHGAARWGIHKRCRVKQSSKSPLFGIGLCLGVGFSLASFSAARAAPARLEDETDVSAPETASLEKTILDTWAAAAGRKLGAQDARAKALVIEAKRLIVDSFPEDRATAENLLVDAIRLSPRYVDAYTDLSRYILWQIANGMKEPAEIQKAAQLAAHVREIAPDRPVGNYLVCEILLALGQPKQANELYQETAKQWPMHEETKVFEARYWSENDPARALVAAQDALGRGHTMDDLSPAIALAVSTRQKQLGLSVGDGLGRFAAVYPDRWLYHRAAMAYADENRTQEARSAYLKAVGLGNDLESRLQLGVLEYTVLRELPHAAEHLEKVRSLLEAKHAGRSESSALVLSHLALTWLEAGNDARASDAGRKALVTSSGSTNIVVPLTEEFVRRKKGELLRAGLEEVAVSNPMQEYVHVTLANMASDRKDYDDAGDRFTAAIALSPARDDLHSARGHVAYRALRYDAALRDFERAAALRPDQAAHHYNKACMLSLLGRKHESLASLREAISLNAELSGVASRDADLAPMRADLELRQELAAIGVGAPRTPGAADVASPKADEAHVSSSQRSTSDSTEEGGPEGE